MSQYSGNSGSYPVFFDATSSANSSGFEESTAPNDNFASLHRNRTIVISPSKIEEGEETKEHPHT